jgi:DNA-binding Lrp family transcriptional regulator
MLAYVFLKARPGEENGVAREVVKIQGVTEAAWTYGFCDMLFKVNVGSVKELNEVVFNKVRRIPGVESTKTVTVSPIPIYGSRTPQTPDKGKRQRHRKHSKGKK